jgi:hypothetical protein
MVISGSGLTKMIARGPSIFKRGHVGPLDPAVVKLIDALARSLAREDDARERLGAQRLPVEPEHIDHDR